MLVPLLLYIFELHLWLSFFLIDLEAFDFASNPLIPAANSISLLGHGNLLTTVILEVEDHLSEWDILFEVPDGNLAIMKIVISPKALFLHLFWIQLSIINESDPIFERLFISHNSTYKGIVFQRNILTFVLEVGILGRLSFEAVDFLIQRDLLWDRRCQSWILLLEQI